MSSSSRLSAAESEDLADVFAGMARELESAGGPGQTRGVATRRAVEMVPGCAHAGIALIGVGGSIRSVAATGEIADRVHAIQNELGEGPCLSSIKDQAVYTVDDLRRDDRWPRFSSRVAAETPVASMVAFRLFTSEDTTGALVLYADIPHAFDAHSRAVGAVLAAHAAIAMLAAREHETAGNLGIALRTSRQIGVAVGILMCNENLSRDRAFDFLVNASQRLNRKLRDVADAVVEAGGLSGDLTEGS